MDILKEIEHQIKFIKSEDDSNYLDSIYTHIERAEFYYNQGKGDVNFFNDVIYRSNQAYEGALKESYKVLAEKTIEEVLQKTPNQIENYLEQNNIFRDRVLQLLKNYRQEWRNKSTHDYKLFFDENEAFIALMSVSSFVHLLLKQIQEKITYSTEQKRLAERKNFIEKLKKKFDPEDSLSNNLINILKSFSIENETILRDTNTNFREYEVLGLIHAYLDSIGLFDEIIREAAIQNGTRILRPDFVIKSKNDSIILEVIKIRGIGSIIRNSANQVFMYMQATGIKNAVLYIVIFNNDKAEFESRVEEHIFGNEKYTLTIFTSK